MYKTYILTAKSSEGVETLKFTTHINKDNGDYQDFINEAVKRVNNYYFGYAENVEILAIKEERFMKSI